MNEAYLNLIQRQIGISRAALLNILNMPYNQAVDLARSIAGGLETPYPVTRKTEMFSSLPGFLSKSKLNEHDIRTCKILLDRVFQARVLLHFGNSTTDELAEWVTLVEAEHLNNAVASGRGVCLLNSHYGPGQVVPLLVGQMLGHAVTSMSWENLYQNCELTAHKNVEVIEMNGMFPARVMAEGIRVLRNSGILHTTGDGFKGLSGTKRDFLGFKRFAAEGYAYAAAHTNALIVPVFSTIDPQGKITLRFHNPLQQDQAEQAQADFIFGAVGEYFDLLANCWNTDFGNVPPMPANAVHNRYKKSLAEA